MCTQSSAASVPAGNNLRDLRIVDMLNELVMHPEECLHRDRQTGVDLFFDRRETSISSSD
ncbi:ORF304 [White spot syndrome virus]|uniref:ORF304 n=1 Tax=White spot syndrome virus TaxID=342409 RepID=A0A2D3I756_9VIRU|nr:ORF304 [White spot syndrome virus]